MHEGTYTRMKSKKKKTKNILILCIGISFALHIMGIFLLSRYSFVSLHGDRFSLASAQSPQDIISHQMIDMAMEICDGLTASKDKEQTLSPSLESENMLLKEFSLPDELNVQEKDFSCASFAYQTTEQMHQISKKQQETYELKKDSHEDLVAKMKEYIKDMPPSRTCLTKKEMTVPLQEWKKQEMNHLMSMLPEKCSKKFSLSFHDHLAFVHSPMATKKMVAMDEDFSLPNTIFPSLEKLNTRSFKELFDIDVTYSKEKQQGEYIFAVTLIPKQNMGLKKIGQNYLFVLDKSSSIEKRRLEKMRHAIVASFSHMPKDSKFNIAAFDDNANLMTDSYCSCSAEFFKKGRNFLLKQRPVTFLSTTEILPLLRYIRSHKIPSKEMNTIIFLTDGEWLTRQKNYRILEQWTRTNPHNIVFYAITTKGDKNLPLLEFFTERNRGGLITSRTQTGMKRQLQRLVQSVSCPIAKNISIQFVSKNKDQQIELRPSHRQKANLFAEEPFVILGKTKSLEDFDVFIQGKNDNKWFNIKKTISFNDAESEDAENIMKLWVQKSAQDCYEKYFTEGDPRYLEQAKSILKPYNMEAAFR